MPRFEVEGVGLVSFPVPESQARTLIQQADRAPYGRGEETIIDAAVRKVWQITPDKVRLGGKTWPATLDSILASTALDLGCEEIGLRGILQIARLKSWRLAIGIIGSETG